MEANTSRSIPSQVPVTISKNRTSLITQAVNPLASQASHPRRNEISPENAVGQALTAIGSLWMFVRAFVNL